jgi:sugar phosphate permease
MQGFVASFAGRTGGALAPIIMATLLMGYFDLPWRTALLIMATGGLFLAVAFVVLYRNSPFNDNRVNEAERDLFREDSLEEKPKGKVLNFWAAIKNRSLSIMVFAQLSNAGADIVYTSVLGSFFLSKEISWEQLGIYASLPLFGGAIGGFAGGFLNDWVIKITGSRKWGRRIMGSAGKAIATVFVFVAIAQTNVAYLAIGLFVVKFFSDWSQPTVWGTCTDIGGPYSATVFSIVNTAGNVGAIIVSLLVIGPLLDSYTTFELINGERTPVTDYFPMFIVVAVLYIVTAICWLFIDCTKPIDPESV